MSIRDDLMSTITETKQSRRNIAYKIILALLLLAIFLIPVAPLSEEPVILAGYVVPFWVLLAIAQVIAASVALFVTFMFRRWRSDG